MQNNTHNRGTTVTKVCRECKKPKEIKKGRVCAECINEKAKEKRKDRWGFLGLDMSVKY